MTYKKHINVQYTFTAPLYQYVDCLVDTAHCSRKTGQIEPFPKTILLVKVCISPDGETSHKRDLRSCDQLHGEEVPSIPVDSTRQTQALPNIFITQPFTEITLHAAPEEHKCD